MGNKRKIYVCVKLSEKRAWSKEGKVYDLSALMMMKLYYKKLVVKWTKRYYIQNKIKIKNNKIKWK